MTNQHVAVLDFPFASHSASLHRLVRRLASAAPEVRFSFISTSKSNDSIFSRPNTSGLDNIKPYNVWDGSPERYEYSFGEVHQAVDYFLRAAPENFKKAIQDAEAETGVKVNCLLTHAFLWFAGEMAEAMGVSWVPFWSAGACSLAVHIYTDIIRSTLGIKGIIENEDRTLEFVPGMSAVKISNLPEGIISGNLQSPFAHMLHSMGSKVPRSTALVVNTFEELDPIITNDLKSKSRMVLHIGPSHLSSPQKLDFDESGCLSWLDKHKMASIAYVSLGTITTPPPSELVALAEALEASEVPFLWSLRDNSKTLLPKGFLERTKCIGKVVSWAPQTQVLSHGATGVFVTHCGWNSVMESVGGGVPLICRPFFGDQKINSCMVEDVWKIGVKVGNGFFTKSGTMKAINRVLSSDEGKKMREKIGVLKENAMMAIGTNGSSAKNFKTLVQMIKINKTK